MSDYDPRTTRPVTAVEVEERIRALDAELERLTHEYDAAERTAARAESRYRIVFETAMLRRRSVYTGPRGGIDQDALKADAHRYCRDPKFVADALGREGASMPSDVDVRDLHIIAESEVRRLREDLRTAGRRLDAMRTLSANIRGQT